MAKDDGNMISNREVDFMNTHGSEVVNMLFAQWNYNDAVSVEREEAYEDGREAGKALGITIGIAEGKAAGIAEGMIRGERQIIYDFLRQLGTIPEDIQKRIEGEQDSTILRKWCIAAPGVKSFEEFRHHIL